MAIHSPTVSGLTFIKNAITLGHPIKESILSIADLCDEVVINVGFDNPELTQDDGTYEYLRDHFPQKKFVFLKSFWDPSLCKDGLILSQQTNLALNKCQGKICQYIQGDECIHEEDLSLLEQDMKRLIDHPKAQGVLFNYLHFYGNTNIVKYTRKSYKREIRLIKNHQGHLSWKDAQGFKTYNQEKLLVLPSKVRIFHYGWARNEMLMKEKVKVMDGLYHSKEELEKKNEFAYKRIWGLHPYKGTHPKVMKEWIDKNQNDIELFNLKRDYRLSDLSSMFSDTFEKLTRYRIGEYKNFKIIR